MPSIPATLHPSLRVVALHVADMGVLDPPEQPDEPERLSYPIGHNVAVEVEVLSGTLYAHHRCWAPDHGLLSENEIGDESTSPYLVAIRVARAIKQHHAEEEAMERHFTEREQAERLEAVLREQRDAEDGAR